MRFQSPSAPSNGDIGFGSVWVEAYRGSYVIRINPQTNAVVATIAMPPIGSGGDGSGRLVVGPHGVWVPISQNTTTGGPALSSELLHIDPATNTVVSHMVFDSISGVVDGPDGLWVLIDPQGGKATRRAVLEIDPASGKTLRTLDLGAARVSPHYTPEVDDFLGSLWIVIADDMVARVDPSRGTVTATIRTPSVPSGMVVMAAAGNHAFIAGADNTVMRVDPGTNCVDAIAFVGGSHPSTTTISVFSGAEGVYAAFDLGALALLDPTTMLVRRSIRLTPPDELFASGAMEGYGSVWYPTFAEDSVLRVHPLG